MEELLFETVRAGDSAELFRLNSVPETAHYLRNGVLHRLEQAEELLQEYLQPENRAYWVINGKEKLGIAALKSNPEQAGDYTVSLYFYPSVWGTGAAAEAFSFLEGQAAGELLASCLTAYIVGENMASCKFFEKNGFILSETLHFPDLSSGLLIYRKPLSQD